jgi:aspartyl-tRNA(Asn)/glutamyl-tRNA(Gln) amidotransferase subunit B
MESLLEAELDDPTVSYLALVEEALDDKEFAKALVNWLVNLEIPLRHDEAAHCNIAVTNQGRLQYYRATHELVKAGKLSSSNAKTLLTTVLISDTVVADAAALAKQHNLIQESDEGEITKIVEKVLAENPKAAEDVKAGEMKAIGFLVGQVMKHSQGRANPGLAQQLIKKTLGL